MPYFGDLVNVALRSVAYDHRLWVNRVDGHLSDGLLVGDGVSGFSWLWVVGCGGLPFAVLEVFFRRPRRR